MNREQRRKAEKEARNSKNAHLDIEVRRNPVYDGAQMRYNAKTSLLVPGEGLKEVTVGTVIVVEPFLIDENSKNGEQKIIGVDGSECMIMDTIVPPMWRGQGIGTLLLQGLKPYYEKMISGIASDEGYAIAMKAGFKKDEHNRWIWDKEWEQDVGLEKT